MEDRCLIRPATETDVPALVAIERGVFSDPWPAGAFTAHMGPPSLVAVTDGEVTGYVFSRPLADEGEILNLAVRSDARGQGLGRRLLEASLSRLQERGVRTVYLEVRVSNVGGLDFYRRMGFEEVGRRPKYYDKPREDALVFAREITPQDGPA